MILLDQHCSHGAPALDAGAVGMHLAALPGWRLVDQHIEREYAFTGYRETIAFVDALAAMIHQQDHHPELRVRYRHCLVAFTTHSAGHAVSINDFICAAKADAIYEERRA